MNSPQSSGTSSSGINGTQGGADPALSGGKDRPPPKSAPPKTQTKQKNLPEKKIEEKRSEKLLGNKSPLVFPSDLSADYYISFNAFKHSQDRPSESKRTFQFDKSIFLPLPGNISDSFSAAYDQENLYIFGNAAKEGMNAMMSDESSGTVSIANAMKKNLPDMGGKAVSSALSKIKNDPSGTGKTAAATAATFMLSGASGPMAAAAKSAFQVTTNPFPVMIFSGTGFKPAFSFDWMFYPESMEEAELIRKICNYFRREMLPEMVEGNSSILKSPAIFEIKMNPDDYTRQFKRCVLTNMGINYAPNGPVFIKADDGSEKPVQVPAAVSLSLTFQEIEVWLADDYYNDEPNSFKVKKTS